MPSTFPSNPQNGDAHANNGKKYIYDGDRGVWVGRGRVDTIDPGQSGVTQFTAQSIIPSEAGTDLGSPEQRFGELYLSGNSIFLGDKVLRESNVIDINTSVQPETLEIQVDATGAGHAPDWLWTWEQTTLPFARLSITNSTQISVPLYQQSTYVINNYSNSLHGDMTQTHSFKLKWIEGAGDDNLVDWVTYTTADDSHPDIDEGNTHTVQRLSFTIPTSIELPTLVAPNVTYTVTNNSAGAYTFSVTQSGNNPQLGPFYRGGTYTINIDATGHPFYFTTDNGTGFVAGSYVGEYTTGVTGSRTESGTITFTVPQDAPDTLYYQCGNHAVMRGVIPVRDLAVEQNSNGNYIIYGQHSQDGHSQRIEIRPLPELASQMCLVYDAVSDTWQPQDLATYVENTPSFENKIKEVAGTATLVAPDGTSLVASVEIYSIESYLPLVDNTRGDIAFAQDTNKLYIWDGTQWITAVADGAASGTGGSSVTMSDTAPAEPSDGDMWYDTTEMNLFVYYADDTSSQWVQVATSASDVDLDDYATIAYVDEQLAANPTADPITITDVTPTNFDGAAGTSFTVTGTGFTANTTAVFTGTNGAEYATGSVAYLSSTSLAITNLNNLPVDNEPYRVKLTESGTSISSLQTIDAGSVPSFTTPSGLLVATTQWDEAIDTAVVASDADGAITGYTVSAGSLPTGVELNATTGAITGTSVAQATTTHTFEIEATDETGNTNSRQYDIQIQNAAPTWNSPAEGGAEELALDVSGSITLNATDPEGEAVSYTSGALPTGLSLSGNVISGTPTVEANTSVAVTASDGFASSIRTFTIDVLSPYSTWADRTVVRSNTIGLSSTINNGEVTDNRGFNWKVAINWGYGSAPARWGGQNWIDAETMRDERNLGSNSRIINMGAAGNNGAFFTDADTFFNGAGPGFSNWYSDNKLNQAYPNIHDDITSALGSPDVAILGSPGVTPNSNGGAVYWQPPAGTFEVMLDFGNSHSNGPCAVTVWNNATGQVEFIIKYGQDGAVDTGTSSLNDSGTATLICRHDPNYVYINSDHAGTIAGSHYYLYR